MVNTGLISTRYADTLLQYAISLGQQEAVYSKMKMLSEMYLSIPQLRATITKPSLQQQEKKKILITASGGSLPSSLTKMFDLILKNEREEFIQYIALRFIHLYRETFNIQHGKLITAVSIDHAAEQELIARIQKIVKSKIEMETVVDPSIIGGFVLSLGDNRWDASISGELSRLRNKLQLVNNK